MNRPTTAAFGWLWPSWLLDIGPVALILLGGTLAIALRPNGSTVPTFVLVLALAITTGALLVRHRAPLVVFAVVLTVTVALDYDPVVVLPMLLMVFTIAESQDRVIVIVAAAIAAAVLIIVAQPLHGNPESFTAVLSRLVAVGLAVALGLFVRARADYVDGLHERAARLERERELLARPESRARSRRRRPVGLPDRAGGAHQRDQARGGRARHGAAGLRLRRPSGDRHRRRWRSPTCQRRPAGTAWSACASGSRCSAASSRPAPRTDGHGYRVRAVAARSLSVAKLRAADRRRPAADARRLPRRARGDRRDGGRRRGRRRPRGGRAARRGRDPTWC